MGTQQIDGTRQIIPGTISGGGGGGGGSLVLLESHSASGSATLDFTAAFTSTYDTYVVELQQLVGSAAANLQLRYSTDGGATYDSGSNYKWVGTYYNAAGATGVSNSNSATACVLIGIVKAASTNGGASGRIEIAHPLGSAYKSYVGQITVAHNDGNYYGFTVAGWYLQTTAVNAVRFLFDSGTIASGTIRIYGVAK